MLYSMKEVCKTRNLSYDTLKYYCNEGLVPNVKRDKNNYRVFDDKDLAWLDTLACLKRCGMSIKEIKEYMLLCLKGEVSIPRRKEILNDKLLELNNKKKEIDDSINYIYKKQNFYDDVLAGKTKYYSNLINTTENLIDLHIHTTYSDGILTPKEIIDEALANKVSTIAICDHDTIDAYNEELFEYAKDKNIRLIHGVEISTKIKKCGIHVLGYNFDLNDKEFREKLYNLRNARHIYLRKVAKKLEELGYIVAVDELDKIDSVTKAHIANDIIRNKENETKLKEVFGYVPQMGEFIETIMNEGCPAYVKKETITPKEAVDIIHKASGKAILAHPVAYSYEDNLTEEDIEKLVIEMQPDGIEANYIYIDRNNVKHNDIALWNSFAKKHNLKTTAGSDFHRKDGIHPIIGLVGEDISLTENEINQIIDFLLHN